MVIGEHAERSHSGLFGNSGQQDLLSWKHENRGGQGWLPGFQPEQQGEQTHHVVRRELLGKSVRVFKKSRVLHRTLVN